MKKGRDMGKLSVGTVFVSDDSTKSGRPVKIYELEILSIR